MWRQFSCVWCNVYHTYLNVRIFVRVNWFRRVLAQVRDHTPLPTKTGWIDWWGLEIQKYSILDAFWEKHFCHLENIFFLNYLSTTSFSSYRKYVIGKMLEKLFWGSHTAQTVQNKCVCNIISHNLRDITDQRNLQFNRLNVFGL